MAKSNHDYSSWGWGRHSPESGAANSNPQQMQTPRRMTACAAQKYCGPALLLPSHLDLGEEALMAYLPNDITKPKSPAPTTRKQGFSAKLPKYPHLPLSYRP